MSDAAGRRRRRLRRHPADDGFRKTPPPGETGSPPPCVDYTRARAPIQYHRHTGRARICVTSRRRSSRERRVFPVGSRVPSRAENCVRSFFRRNFFFNFLRHCSYPFSSLRPERKCAPTRAQGCSVLLADVSSARRLLHVRRPRRRRRSRRRRPRPRSDRCPAPRCGVRAPQPSPRVAPGAPPPPPPSLRRPTVRRAAAAAAVCVAACTASDMTSSDDEWTTAVTARHRSATGRSRRSGVAATAQGPATATTVVSCAAGFPSVGRLVEKYTMLIERHRQQQQNGVTPRARRKPAAAKPVAVAATTATVTTASVATTAADISSDYSSLSKSAGDPPSSPAFSDDAWTRLMDDEPPDDAEHYVHLQQRRHRLQLHHHQLHRGGKPLQDDDRRFSCESLGSIAPGTFIACIMSGTWISKVQPHFLTKSSSRTQTTFGAKRV